MPDKPTKNEPIRLSPEQWDRLETLAALDFPIEQIALYFGIDKNLFRQHAQDPNSHLALRITTGKARQDADEHLALYDLAKKGDLPAQKQLHEIKRTRAFKIAKMDIFGAFENRKTLERLNDYVQSGAAMDISVEEQIYIDALLLIRDMDSQYGRRATVDFFVKQYKIKHQRASEMYDEAISLFYGNRNASKKAMRHKYAERLENAAAVVASSAENARDWEVYGNLMKQAAAMHELDRPDTEKLPMEMYMPTVKVYTLDTEAVGLPAINRNELAAEIDALQQPEAVKASLRQDARIDPIDIAARLEQIEEEHKK